jgi:hypothetical protein
MIFSYDPILKALEESEIRYVVVGGVAVVLHGAQRNTMDLDIVVDPSPEAGRRLIQLFRTRGLMPRLPVPLEDFADPDLRRQWREEKEIDVFTVLNPDEPFFAIDLFLEPPIPFEELYARSELRHHAGYRVRVASVDDLVRMKLEADRPKDRLDIYNLRNLPRLEQQDE